MVILGRDLKVSSHYKRSTHKRDQTFIVNVREFQESNTKTFRTIQQKNIRGIKKQQPGVEEKTSTHEVPKNINKKKVKKNTRPNSLQRQAKSKLKCVSCKTTREESKKERRNRGRWQ